jgi:hypothetical protein
MYESDSYHYDFSEAFSDDGSVRCRIYRRGGSREMVAEGIIKPIIKPQIKEKMIMGNHVD